jgi:hypothetical protein
VKIVPRCILLFAVLAAPLSLPAQHWVSGAELPLVREASALRSAQATDTTLASWRATAHGVLRLMSVSEPGTVSRSEPVKVDELTATVYGRLPDRVKQIITTWRDTALAGLRLPIGQIQFTLDAGVERSDSVVTMRPLRNDKRPNPNLAAGTAAVARLGIGRRWLSENEISARIEIGRGDADWQRVSGNVTLYQALGAGRARLSVSGGAGSHGLPGYRNFVLGGSSTLPGISPRSLGGRSMALADLSYECRLSMACLAGVRPRRPSLFSPIVAPFVAMGQAGGDNPLLPWRGDNLMTTVAGLRLSFGTGILTPIGGAPIPFGGVVSFSLGARIR